MVSLKNCNNIDATEITIESGKLNIKYGTNGTGKSSIARAIDLGIRNADLLELTPFKFRPFPAEKQKPSIQGVDNFKSVKMFNDEYIQQILFKPDELVANSFNIFINTPDYAARMAEIDSLIQSIRTAFKNNAEIETLFNDLCFLRDKFGKDPGISKRSPLYKSIGKGNPVKNIPQGLEKYQDFINLPNSASWVGWQIQGNKFLEASPHCPYCTSPTAEVASTIKKVKEVYIEKEIEHLNGLLRVATDLKEYFSESTFKELEKILNNADGLDSQANSFLKEIREQVSLLCTKMQEIKEFSYFSTSGNQVENQLNKLCILTAAFSHLSSPKTISIFDKINGDINDVLDKVGILKGKINHQQKSVQETIKKHVSAINSFLGTAGYPYLVDIPQVQDTFKIQLRHIQCADYLNESPKHLSYGERNAFSLILFMYECLREQPDLIILDDPISSFDKNKKYAIIHRLFKQGTESFRNKTVLMMTHDFEPIIDMVHTMRRDFPIPEAHFLAAKSGLITETKIERSDIMSFTQICKENLKVQSGNPILKIIHLRRFFELHDNKGVEYHLLSSLVHKRAPSIPKDSNPNEFESMIDDDIANASSTISSNYISGFNYDTCLDFLKDDSKVINLFNGTNNNYEKLQLFRIIMEGKMIQENDIITKFINETYHIENEYVMQLNPLKYDPVPQYIIDECNATLKKNCR